MMTKCYQLVPGSYTPHNSPQYPFLIINYPHNIPLQHLYTLPLHQIPLLNTCNTCVYSQNSYLPISPGLFKDLITPKTIDGVSYARLVQRPNGEQYYMKVQIIPYILYTDETSGNTSKQYNKFDSVQMVPAALPISESNKRENMHFVLTSNKKLSVVDMLPSLVEDLVYMERGFVAYSSFYDEDVLVVSPLCFIAADNPRHAGLSNLMGHSANYFCRKCL